MYKYDPRHLELLYQIADMEPVSSTELLEAVPFSKSTLHRRLKKLEEDGYVTETKMGGRYEVTFEGHAVISMDAGAKASVAGYDL